MIDHEKAGSLDCIPWLSRGCGGREARSSAASGARAPQSPPTLLRRRDRQGAIIRNVNLVEVLFSVVTKREKLVTDLNKEDFKVFDDGAQQEITDFSQPTDLPLRIGMVLDTSNSIRERLKFEQDAAIDFIFNALRRGKRPGVPDDL